MGLFNKIIKKSANNSKEENNPIPWNVLNRIEQLDVITELSKKQPVAIFKHSTRCSISRYVLSDFISGYSFSAQDFGAWYLDLLNFRSISNAVADRLEVTHQSPQLLVIKNGKVVAHSSHEQINSLVLSGFLN